jgi:uncharacterized repeat protein (TIGR02543 family)
MLLLLAMVLALCVLETQAAAVDSRTAVITMKEIENADVAYAYTRAYVDEDGKVTERVTVQGITPLTTADSGMTIRNFSGNSDGENGRYTGYLIFFLKPSAADCLLYGISTSGSGHIYSLDSVTSKGAIQGYANLEALVTEAKNLGYVAAFGYSRGYNDTSGVDASFSVKAIQATLGVTAQAEQGCYEQAKEITFTVTPTTTDLTAAGENVTLTKLELQSLTVNGKKLDNYKQNEDGTITVTYTPDTDDLKGDLKLSVTMKATYGGTLSMTEGQAVSGSTEVTETATATVRTHIWGEGEVVQKPSCTVPGTATYTCERCGTIKTEEIAALGHDYGPWQDNGNGTHTRVCRRDKEHTETEVHSYGSWGSWTASSVDGVYTRTRTCTAADCTASVSGNGYRVAVRYYISGTETELQTAKQYIVEEGGSYDSRDDIPASLTYQGKTYVKESVSGAVSGSGMSGPVTIYVYYTIDEIGGENGDGIPDKYQVLVRFITGAEAKGTVEGDGITQVFTFQDDQGNYLTSGDVTPSKTGITTNPKTGYGLHGWTRDSGTALVDPFATMKAVPGGSSIVFKAQWKPSTAAGTLNMAYQVVHYQQQPDGEYQVIQTDTKYASLNSTVTAEALQMANYYVNTEKSNTQGQVITPTVDADQKVQMLVLNLYYDRNQVIETKYTLSYVTGGGTEYQDERYAAGTQVDLSKVPSREGYRFSGWYADEALTERITSVTMDQSKTVYAGWVASTVPDQLNGEDHYAYIVGYEDGTVRPQGNITRAEVATIFFRLLKEDIREGALTSENPFTDVAENAWYCKAVSTLTALGIIQGRTETEFDPNAAITRAELATICARFDTGITSGGSDFTDIEGHWAQADIEKAAALGWVQGDGDGKFRPNDSITRAEAITMINRVLCRIPESESDLLADMNTWPDNMDTDQWYYLAVQEATNSHDFAEKGAVSETWNQMKEDPDWEQYEK